MPKKVYAEFGTVQAVPGAVYVRRKADDELLQMCLEGNFAFVLSARQVGKSSLMVETASRLRELGVVSAMVDLQEIGVNVTDEEWYLGFTFAVAEQLGLETDVRAWWREHIGLGMTQRLLMFFERVILQEISGKVVIFVDEIDTTLSLSFTDDFFAAIRLMYNRRATEPAFGQLSFVLMGVANPTDLIRDAKRTPFNIGRPVELADWTLVEALPLAEGLGETGEDQLAAMKHVLAWTGGHPYLTQRLAGLVATAHATDPPEQAVDSAAEQAFLGPAGLQDSNLRFIHDMLTKRAPNPPGMGRVLSLYRRIISGQKAVRDADRVPAASHLKLSGIVVRGEDGNLQVRNAIYRQVFGDSWLKRQSPPLVKEVYRAATPFQRVGTAVGLMAVLSGVVALSLGLGGQFSPHVHTPLSDLPDYDVLDESPVGTFTSVSLGDFGCGLRKSGRIICWGRMGRIHTNPPRGRFRDLSVGTLTACGIRFNGRAACWGRLSRNPTRLRSLSVVSVGDGFACGLDKAGRVTCWGPSPYPKGLRPPEDTFSQLSVNNDYAIADSRFACGLRQTGRITCWGSQLGSLQQRMTGRFRYVSASAASACGIRYAGQVNCWHRNDPNLGWSRGEGHPPGWDTGPAVVADPKGRFVAVAAASNDADLVEYACGIRQDRSILCWGGHGRGEDRVPRGAFSQVVAAGTNVCGLRVDGRTACWRYDTGGG